MLIAYPIVAILLAVIFIPISAVQAEQVGHADSLQTIIVDAHAAYDVSGRNDINLMRGYYQGSTWTKPFLPETWQRLQPLGITRLRMINDESSDAIQIDSATNRMSFNFASLRPGLQDCKKFNLIPHIIVGLHPQTALMITKDGKKYGVRDWGMYEQYVYAFLKFVMVEQGFVRADFEVGNEPHTNGTAWLLPDKLPFGDSKTYTAYLHLYQVWSGAADRLSREHPELNLRIGGPDAGPNTFAGGSFNWYGQFVEDVAKQKLRLDFCSFHFYGNVSALAGLPTFGRYPTFAGQIEYIRKSLNNAGLNGVPIYVTEWGPSYYVYSENPQGIINGNYIGAAWTARFLVDMVDAKVDEGMSLLFSAIPVRNGTTNNWNWPSFLLSDGVTQKAMYNVALMFSKLPDQRVRASGNQGSLGVLASAGNKKVGVLMFNQNWDYPGSKERANIEHLQLRIVGLPFAASRVHVTRYLVDETHSDAYGYYQRGLPMSQKNVGLNKVHDITVPVINGVVNLTDIGLGSSSVSLWEVTPENQLKSKKGNFQDGGPVLHF